MTDSLQQLQQAIAALESQRPFLGDAVVEAGLAPMRARLAALQAQERASEQRRLVTVLFADLVGFTSWAERLDAEEVHDHLQSLWRQLDKAVFDHGGQIDKHMGDGLMALWGRDTVREDDAERAIRAALAMQSHLAQLGDATIRLRVGISSGLVLVGTLGAKGEVTALGDTVNLASRLEHAAPPGGVLIAHDTYRHVRGIFDVEVLPPLAVRGKRDPVQTYLVKGARPRSFFLGSRGVEGIETQMVGRDHEFARLQGAYSALHKEATVQALTIVGEAGLGKSRLLYEFLSWVALQPHPLTIFKGRAAPQMRHLPFALLRDLFAFHFDLQESDEPPVARRKVEEGIAFLLGDHSEEGRMRAQFIGHLLGFDFAASPHLRGVVEQPQQVRERALRYLTQLFGTVARQGPVLVILEDLHWADDATLDTFQALLTQRDSASILLVALTRPTLFEHHPSWGEGQLHHSRLALQPLSPRASQRLLEDILRHLEALPAELSKLVVEGAEGNPFYIEELVKMLIEAGVIVQGAESWRVEAEQLGRTQVPATLVGVLQARLDSLPASERELLQRAAVIGRTFWDGAATALCEAPPRVEQEAAYLAALRQRELVFRRESSAFKGATEYLFKHALLRDVAYESTLKRLRRAYHKRAAQWLAGWGESRTYSLGGLIAEHYVQAGEIAAAAPWYLRAAQQAQGTHDTKEAVRYYEQALACGTPVERLEALFGLGECSENASTWDVAENHYQQARVLAEAESNDLYLARAYHRLGSLRWVQGKAHEALSYLEQAQRGYRQAGDAPRLIQVLIDFGRTYQRLGEYQLAQDTLRRSLTLAREQQSWQEVGDALYYLGSLMLNSGNYAEARALYEESLSLLRANGTQRHLVGTLNNLALLHLSMGEYDAARHLLEENLSLRKKQASQRGITFALGNLGSVAYLQERYGEARAFLGEGLAQAREMGDKEVMGSFLNLLGNVALAKDERATAASHQREGLIVMRELGNPKYLIDSLIGVAGTLTLDPATPLHYEEAAQLLAVAERYLAQQGTVLDADVQPVYSQVSQRLQQTLDPSRLAAIQVAAQAMSLDEGCTHALELLEGLIPATNAS